MTTIPPSRHLIVTIDGPAGTGKSSVARAAASRLHLEFLDTGSMYRAATALALDRGIPVRDEHAVAASAADAHLRFDWTTDPPTMLAHGRSIAHRLRAPDVDASVSVVASLPAVREVLVGLQQAIGRSHARLITEGRDQGSVVFPEADAKIYLHASPAARARRRADQLRAQGRHADEAEIARELAERDDRDSRRAVGPLRRPEGAVDLDTSDLTFEESVDAVIEIARRAAEQALPFASAAGNTG